MFDNGILNDKEAAAKYAAMHSQTDGPQYVVHFPKANNIVSELLIAGYQKNMENDFWGLTNATSVTKDLMERYGASGIHFDAHSRGGMTVGNALESITKKPGSAGQYGNLTINMVGPAYNALKADELLAPLQGRKDMSEAEAKAKEIQYQTHKDDFVGTVLGGNKPTGGDRPEGTTKWGQYLNILTGTTTVHNCYVTGSPECESDGFWNSSPLGKPQWHPASYQKINKINKEAK